MHALANSFFREVSQKYKSERCMDFHNVDYKDFILLASHITSQTLCNVVDFVYFFVAAAFLPCCFFSRRHLSSFLLHSFAGWLAGKNKKKKNGGKGAKRGRLLLLHVVIVVRALHGLSQITFINFNMFLVSLCL
jgi:hypothetical protein